MTLLTLLPVLTSHQSQYITRLLTRRAMSGSVESLALMLVDSQVDLVEAALFARQSPLSSGVILADEVSLDKTIEAGLVISQLWTDRRRRILIIAPANLHKQWHQERQNPFLVTLASAICSYQFAKAKVDDIKTIEWDLVELDETHRLSNVYKTHDIITKILKDALKHVHAKVLLTATPLKNSLLDFYGFSSMIHDWVLGDIDSFHTQFTAQGRDRASVSLREGYRGRKSNPNLKVRARSCDANSSTHKRKSKHSATASSVS